ncbi:MAG: SPASM domain-containing protein, partial [Patescibacteria group bacterium]|nr:SPASM domain-containing protein [Patescibacteria group bacterium]
RTGTHSGLVSLFPLSLLYPPPRRLRNPIHPRTYVRGSSKEQLGELTNAGEIAEAARLAKEIGCNYFEFKPMVDLKHYLIPFSQEMSQIVAEQYETAKQLEDDNFAVVAPKSMEFLQEHPNPVQPKDYERCAVMEFRTLVTPTGIYPCPYMRGREDKRMGSVDDEPFDSFWNSSKRIETMSKINPSRDCGFYCIRHLPNVTLNHIRSMEEQGVRILDSIKETPDLEDPFF